MIKNWTWELLVEEAQKLKPGMEVETASYYGQDPKTDLAWFKVSGHRMVERESGETGLFAAEPTLEKVEDWTFVQLPSSHAIAEPQEGAA